MSEKLQNVGSEPAEAKPDKSRAEISRRRLLRMSAYAAPLMLTFGMPKPGQACQSPCTNTWQRPRRRRCWWFWF
jgi:hypothetical protein